MNTKVHLGKEMAVFFDFDENKDLWRITQDRWHRNMISVSDVTLRPVRVDHR